MGALLGIFLHAVGGFASGSFYIPYKRVKGWSWESYWLVGGVFSWLIAPWLVAVLTVPGLWSILSKTPAESLFWTYLMGALWGVGGLTFGLTMRYLGLSLGMAIALGFCAAFGTVIPPLYEGTFTTLLSQPSGQTIFAGVLVCLIGIGLCGWAGMVKEREMPEEAKRESIREFNFRKGFGVAVFSGILSACMAFGIAAGKPIAAIAVAQGVSALWQQGAVLVVVLAGGLTTNLVWCVILNIRNQSAGDYVNGRGSPLASNYFFSFLAGGIWYLQFMFYGMGTTRMGQYDFSSWTLHMAFIIIFSNGWGLYFNEWKGSSRRTMRLIALGIGTVILSTVLVGIGNYLAASQ